MTAQLSSAVTPASPQPSAATPGGLVGLVDLVDLVRAAWRRIRLTVGELNYATERVMDVRVPR